MENKMHTVTHADYAVAMYETLNRDGTVTDASFNIYDLATSNREITEIILRERLDEQWDVPEGYLYLVSAPRVLAIYHLNYHSMDEPRILNFSKTETQRQDSYALSVRMEDYVPKYNHGNLLQGSVSPLYTERPLEIGEYRKFALDFFEALVSEYEKLENKALNFMHLDKI